MAIRNMDEEIGIPVVLPVDDQDWTTYSGSISGTGSKTFTTYVLKYRQVRNGYRIAFGFESNNVASGGAATEVNIPLPSGAVIDTNFLQLPSIVASNFNNLGFGFEYGITALSAFTPLSAIIPSTTTLLRLLRNGGGAITAANMNNTNIMVIEGEIWVPIVGLSAYRAYGAGKATTQKDGLVAPRGNWVDLTVTGTAFSPSRCKGRYYQEQDGTHKLAFVLNGSLSAVNTTVDLAVSGVVFSSLYPYGQPVTLRLRQAGVATRPVLENTANPGANTISAVSSSGSFDVISIVGDVELASKPTWAP